MLHRAKKFTQEQFIDAVSKSFSVAGTLKSLGLVPAGGNYLYVHRHVKLLQLDTSHWTGMGHLKGKRHSYTFPDLSQILVIESTYYGGTSRLKKHLLKAGLLENKCAICPTENIWCGAPLSLHLDHINGIRSDNRLENLRLLCPNCHSQTPTYAGKNKGVNKK